MALCAGNRRVTGKRKREEAIVVVVVVVVAKGLRVFLHAPGGEGTVSRF